MNVIVSWGIILVIGILCYSVWTMLSNKVLKAKIRRLNKEVETLEAELEHWKSASWDDF